MQFKVHCMPNFPSAEESHPTAFEKREVEHSADKFSRSVGIRAEMSPNSAEFGLERKLGDLMNS